MTTRKWGNEFIVNTTTAGQQDQSAVTALADGGFMVAWRDDGITDSTIRLQRYDARGNAVGGEINIADAADYGLDQSSPSIVQLADGNLLVTQTDVDTLSDRDVEGTVITLSGAFVRTQQFAGSSSNESSGQVASLGTNGSVGVFVDNDANGGDIRMDIRDSSGNIFNLVNNLAVNTDAAGSLAAAQYEPMSRPMRRATSSPWYGGMTDLISAISAAACSTTPALGSAPSSPSTQRQVLSAVFSGNPP